MKKAILTKILIIILIFLAGGVAGFFLGQGPVHLKPRPRHQPWSVNDTARIQTWLTFDYINFVFRLPPIYLESKLPARDTRYPNISIETYAEKHQLDKTKFLETVRTDVKEYFTPTASSTATTSVI